MRLGQNSTSGGASDSAAKAWQANPAGPADRARGDDRDAGAEVAEDLPEHCRPCPWSRSCPGQPRGAQSGGPTG